MDPVRKRRFSRDAGINFSAAIASLQLPTAAQNTISLRAAGTARLIFHGDTTSFEGVLITDDGGETFAIKGAPSTNGLSDEDKGRRSVDVRISDGETGQLYVIRGVYLSPAPRTDNGGMSDRNVEVYHTLSKRQDIKMFQGNSAVLDIGSGNPNSLSHENQEHPRYELHSEALNFVTDEILVGNRADKEIRAYLTPTLVSQLFNVHIGRMKVEFNAAITPPPTPVYDRTRRKASRQFSVSSNGDSANGSSQIATDADVNFLM